MREFIVSAYYGEQNKEHKKQTIICKTPWDAATKFARDMQCEVLSVRVEGAVTQDDKLYSQWSAGWTGSGQRIWIKEQIGGF